MAFNVYKNGQWGTFRHLQLEDSNIVESEHCFVNISARGDLSSLQWTQGPLKYDTTPEPDKELIYVYYSSLNRKDVMTVTGDLNLDTDADPSLGFEFSGRGKRGHRCMGISEKGGAISNLLLTDKSLIYPVPDDWSLEEAATVPVAYTTAIYALIMRGAMKEGESVLIHSGAGGVGQAAIYLALLYGCKVFTTVGNSAKREFLRKTYPQLRDVDIGCSRDETFEQMVLKQTNGKGVDIVLNSLGEGRLVASVRCLAASGRFLEIGQSDLTSNKHLDMLLFSKQASFHGITVDGVCDNKIRSGIRMIFRKLMAEGGIKPLSRTAFRGDEVEQAFRFMATGNHIGKVLIKVRESEEQLKLAPPKLSLKGVARYYCEPQHVYIIVGGLGGMGLELAGWLVLRGARKLVLTSRKGITTGYQRYRVRLWESYGAVVKISTAPVASREGCEQLIEEGSKLGSVVAIFNLAVELEDAIFGNHSPKSFGVPFAAKAVATKHLDDVTRTMCGELRDFVVFSSVACGRGSPGQTNYGMANSVMERICEERNRNGYPALAIQWGQVGGVGIVADMHENTGSEIVGTVPQSIFSCLQVLDTFLTQGNASVVSSMVAAHKQEALSVDNIVDSVINTLGVRDVKQVSFQSTLAELGMNSLIAIEVKLTLQREFGISFSTKDLRSMTLARLKEIQKEKNGTSQVVEKNC